MDRKEVLKNLQVIPGIGKSLAEDLYGLGIRKVNDLVGKDPEELYNRQCEIQGIKVDRCILYTFRCAVYFASNTTHDPKKLQWWNWKDEYIKLK